MGLCECRACTFKSSSSFRLVSIITRLLSESPLHCLEQCGTQIKCANISTGCIRLSLYKWSYSNACMTHLCRDAEIGYCKLLIQRRFGYCKLLILWQVTHTTHLSVASSKPTKFQVASTVDRKLLYVQLPF